ncbi:MAG: hypothetical protein FJW37_08595 [Acidobacteria bacterium]|nr:hypothetical protein [Acidobacteriota bacterium]
MTKIARISLGFLLVFVGVIGILLPVMPGWVLLIPGLIILAEHFSWARNIVEGAKRKAEKYGGEACRRYVRDSRGDKARRETSGD